jgi:endonuclease/exonuclease/phosphatase family metal-dependent hydrolase
MSEFKLKSLVALGLVSTHALGSPIEGDENEKPAGSSLVESSPRASARRMKYELSGPHSLLPMGVYVGELQEKWTFPSDHLPIAMTFEDLNIVSWNVLDAEYMSWVTEKNSQGLSRSMIADEHVYIGETGLTIRDQHVVNLVLEMISHPTHPRSILSLQECSEPFLAELRSRLPARFEIVSHHGNAVLIDTSRLELVEANERVGIFANEPERTFQDLTLRRLGNGQLLRVLNAHLPGDPTKPGRYEFVQYLADSFDPAVATLAMGDMNFNELEMGDAMNQAFPVHSPFTLYSPYCTNISVWDFKSKVIDHFFVYSAQGSSASLNAPEEIMDELAPVVSLLNP